MSKQKVLRRWRMTAMVLYFLAGFIAWFAANAWILVKINHHAIVAVDVETQSWTAHETAEMKRGVP